MPFCPKCSTSFKSLPEGKSCGKCLLLQPKLPQDYVVCKSCGAAYEFLETGKDCGSCVESASAAARVDYGRILQDPGAGVDPRTYTAGASARVRAVEELSEFERRAADVTSRMNSGYGNAQARALINGSQQRVAKPNFALPSSIKNVPTSSSISLIIKEAVNRHDKKLKTTFHTPTILTYPDDTLFKTIAEEIRANLDKTYLRQFQKRIRETDEFELQYYTGKSAVPEEATSKTLKHLWNRTLVHGRKAMSQSAMRDRLLELIAIVDYPPHNPAEQGTQLGAGESQFSTIMGPPAMISRPARKRSGTLSADDRPTKRAEMSLSAIPMRSSSSWSPYETSVSKSIQSAYYTAVKITCEMNEEGVTWVKHPGEMSVRLDDEHFASGVMKRAFKARISGQKDDQYVAKTFYRDSSEDDATPPPPYRNDRYLKSELLCAQITRSCLQGFKQVLRERKIDAFDLSVADGFLVEITQKGHLKGDTFLVDRFLPGKTRKFSGTRQAGQSQDLLGQTCDAFAHFSLAESDGCFVLVDIQGILSKPLGPNGKVIPGPDVLVLFDLMAHSKAGDKGIGDRGPKGIHEFWKQHHCNTVCGALAPAMGAVVLPAIVADDDDLYDENQGNGSGTEDAGGEDAPKPELVDYPSSPIKGD